MSSTASPNYRHYALALLLSVNLLNCIDRQVLYAVCPLIKAGLKYAEITVNCSLLTHEEACAEIIAACINNSDMNEKVNT